MPSLMEKGWRESADKTPQHKYDIRLTDFFTPIIVGALQDFARSLPIESVVAMFSHDNVKDVDKKKLRQQIVATLGNGDSEKLNNVMLDLYAASYSAGKHAGDEQFADIKIVKASYDWSAWEPGDIQASNALIDGGLKSLWGGANIIVSGLNDTTVDRIGNRIADGLMLGLPSGDIADSIYDLVGDPYRAEMIAHTESTRGMQAGTLESYNSNGVGRWELLPADGACEECLALVGQEFPAIDLNDMPPIHPWCRCSTIPVIDSIAFDELGNPAGITDLLATLANAAVQDVVADLPTTLLDGLTPLELANMDTFALQKGFQELYENVDFAGFNIKMQSEDMGLNPVRGRVKVYGDVYSGDGTKVGLMERIFEIDREGNPFVYHAYLKINEAAQGQGFSTSFGKYSEAWYRANGYKYIKVEAALDKGAYTWARAGYQWDTDYYGLGKIEQRPTEVINGLSSKLNLENLSSETRLKMNDFIERFQGPIENWPTPFEVASLSDPAWTDLGKRVLRNTSWHGVKSLI